MKSSEKLTWCNFLAKRALVSQRNSLWLLSIFALFEFTYLMPVIIIVITSDEFRKVTDHVQGPVSLTIFARNSNSMETSPCCNSCAGHQITTIFCTCHDSNAVVPCTKFCSDHCIRIEVKRNFHRIWIAMEKPLVKRGPGLDIQLHPYTGSRSVQDTDCCQVSTKPFAQPILL